MKIAIDISSIVYGTGVSVYTKELVRALLAIDQKNHYLLFGGSLRRKDELKEFLGSLSAKNFTGKIFSISPTLGDLLWNRFHKLPIESLIGPVDVFHSSDWTQPVSAAYKVTTIHDLVPVKYPEWSHPVVVKTHTRRLKWVKSEVDTIIVPSQQTKDDLMLSGFAGHGIKVIPEAVDPEFKRASASEMHEACVRYEVKSPYLLSVGITTRKNTQRIIDAFSKLRAERKYESFSLVLIGHPYIDIKSAENVIMTGHVEPVYVAALYTGAECLVYPSLYEGFGLPILEAMKVGTPVVTTHSGSMRETAGKAAILVDPENTDEIWNGMKRALQLNRSLVKKGKEREKEFSWEKTAEMTLGVYETVNRVKNGK